jgi:flagellar biosynthesis/type III secretory pathway protein FliH
MSDEATLASGYGGAYEAGWQSGREDGRKEERARIRAAIEAVMSRHYDQFAAGLNTYDEGALDALDHALHAIDRKDTTHD